MSEELKKVDNKKIIESVLKKVNNLQETGVLQLPENYKPGNALKASALILSETLDKNGKNVFETCSQESIANALLFMVVRGLDPYLHGAFIAYAGKLHFQPEYTADIFIAKRDANVEEVRAVAVFEKDEFEYETINGITKVLKHKSSLRNRNSKVVGAYCIVVFENGNEQTFVMSIEEIIKSWNMRKGNGLTRAHQDFPDQMSEKTVIRRALKRYIKSSIPKIKVQEKFNNNEITDVEFEEQPTEEQEIIIKEEENNNIETAEKIKADF